MDISQYPALLDPSCPWVSLRESTGLPNVKWCEQTLCAVIAEPANTWSNLAFGVSAAVLAWLNRGETSRTLRFWTQAAIWVGVTSLVYHATVTFLTQVLDFFGMYFFFGLLLLVNLVRVGVLAKEKLFVWLWGSIAALTAFTVAVAKLGVPVQGIIVVMILATLGSEVAASRRASARHGWFFAALGCILVAATFSALDASRRWCDPSSHVLQGHAIWHCLAAISMVLTAQHYRQFRGQLT